MNPLRILLVDDDPNDRVLTERALAKEFPGFQVTHVLDADILTSALGAGQFDLVITDYRLRWTDGLSVLKLVRHHKPGCPVIMFTGTGNEEVAVEAMKTGLDDYILKSPKHFARLPVAVRAILERAESNRRAVRLQLRLENLLNRLKLGVYRSTLDGRLKEANPAFMELLGTGRSQQQVKDIDLYQLGFWPQDARAHWTAHMAEEHPPPQTRTLQHERGDGSTVWIELTETGHTLEDHTVVVDGIIEDITERKQLERQLLHAQRMEAVGRLAGGIAHDFNNMMSAVTGYTSLLLVRMDENHPFRPEIEEIEKACARANAVTRQLLLFTRKQILEPAVINLNALVTDTEKMLRHMIGEDIELVTDSSPSLGSIRVDPGSMEQLIVNLAVNARDAMPKGGKLVFRTADVDLDETYAKSQVDVTPGPYVMLEVSDNGTGMDEETMTQIFEPFFTTKEAFRGTGLGLSIVYGVVRQSGGHIRVLSEPGKGTSFKLYFPRIEGDTDHPESSPDVLELFRGSEHILVVEDDADLRRITRTVLARFGYQVTEASSGHDAIRLCELSRDPIHLLLTDVIMPRMSGRDLAESLKASRPDTKVLFMSGYTDNHISLHGVLEPGTHLVTKPFTMTDLLRKVRDVLDGK